MGFPINPPNAPLIMSDGRTVTPEWYKFFLEIQRMIGGPSSPFDDAMFLSALPEAPVEGSGADGGQMVPPAVPIAADDALPPPPRGAECCDDFLMPYSPQREAVLYQATAGAALTKADDTNVTLTLGGTPTTALLRATSLTLGWTGTLAVSRGGTGGGAASGTLLDNIAGFSSTGMMARTASGTYAFRTVTGTANEITVTNGDGVSGAPTLSLPTALTFTGKTITGGTWNSAGSITSTSGNILYSGFIRCNAAISGIGYTTGAGSTVTQITSKATAVTINRANGNITTHNANLAAATVVQFTVNNSAVEANDNFVINHISGGTLGAYLVSMAATGAGTAQVTLTNLTAGTLGEAITLKFSLIKGSIT